MSAESQTAINQLADLGITKGTSATTYSPDDAVKRGHMALFIARLMDKMKPMADGDTPYGYTPEDVVDKDDDESTANEDESKTVKSPFTDLQSSIKEAYDAITALWEMGVASGISATSYAPDASITRASMADFIAGVLDHSNARPAGVTIQASETWAFGNFDAAIAVSYRDDMFMPMVDVSIKTFASGNDTDTGVGSFNEDGGCGTPADCAWTDDESLTDASGNIFEDGSVSNGKNNTYYAWMGDPDEDENDFNVSTSPHSTVTLSSTTDAVSLKVTTDISSESTNKNTMDIDSGDDVTLTAQLVDETGAAVAKSGVKVNIRVQQGADVLHPGPAPMETDDDGQVSYTTGGPKSTKGNSDNDRVDTITFSSDIDADDTTDAATGADTGDGTVAVSTNGETVVATIFWTDSNATLVTIPAATGATTTREAQGTGKGSTDPYTLRSGQGKVTIRATVSLYDQYGNAVGKGEKVAIDIGAADSNTRTVSSRGMASWRATFDAALDSSQTVTYALRNADDSAALGGAPDIQDTTVHVVAHADDDTSADAILITAVYVNENRFRIAGALYTYDSDDVFISDNNTDDGKVVDLAAFEKLIGGTGNAQPSTQANIEIVAYDDDGSSIFRVATASTP